MLIYFIYKNNSFNFNIKNDVSISYIKNMVSKMIQKEKSCFDLFYNNKIISESSSSLFQITKNESNIPIIISLKKNNIKMKLPLLTMPNKSNKNTIDIEPKMNLNLNETELSADSFMKDINQNFKSYTKIKNGSKIPQKEYISRNKVFEDVYNSKDEQIITLMKNLRNKILEFDDALYKKYKTSSDKDNTQLLLYEKNIINFKDKQIQFFKKLISYFDKAEASFSKYKINLEEFYLELSNYNNNINNNNKNSFELNDSIKKEKNIFPKNLKLSQFSDKKLKNISIIKSTDDNLQLYNKASEDSDYSAEILKEKINKILDNKKSRNEKAKKDQQINLTKSIKMNNIKQINLKENFFSKNKRENNLPKLKTFKKKSIIINEENVKNPQNTSKNLDNKNNKVLDTKQIMRTTIESEDRIEMKTLDKNKIDVLFEISENKHEDTGTLSHQADESRDESENNPKEKDLVRALRKKTLNYNQLKDIKIPFAHQTHDRKKSHRLKKLGSNVFDFII